MVDYWRYGVCLLGIAVFGSLGYKCVSAVKNSGSYIATNGLSDRLVKSDVAKLDISFANEANALSDIQDKRTADKKAIIGFLLKSGFKKEEVSEGSSSIEDALRWTDKTEGKKKYRVTDNLVLETKQVDLVEKSIPSFSQLIDKDVFVDVRVRYLCKGIDKLKIEMIEEAVKDSQIRAEHVAKNTGKKLDGLRNLSTGKFSIFSEDSPTTSENDYSDGERSLIKRIRVVVRALFNIA